jgi:PIN domain nuclease of toxin-antitoxin system
VRLLIDTHTFIWWMDASPALSATARAAIADPGNEILISIASIWEMSSTVAPFGARLAHALPRRWLEIGFGLFLLLAAARFLASLV